MIPPGISYRVIAGNRTTVSAGSTSIWFESMMSMWTRNGIELEGPGRRISDPASPRGNCPPMATSTSRSPFAAASIMSGAVSRGCDGTSNPHCSLKLAALSLIDRRAARERRGIGAHFGPALHAGMTADRHQPALVASDEPPGQGEIDDRADSRLTILCCVTPMLQTKTAVRAFPTSSPKVRIWAVVAPDACSRSDQPSESMCATSSS